MPVPEKLTPIEIADKTGVSEDQVADVLDYLVSEGWMLGRFVEFNLRSEGNLELPDETATTGSYFIVVTENDGEIDYNPPKQASSPENAILSLSIIPDEEDSIQVFSVRENPDGDLMYWDKDDLDF